MECNRDEALRAREIAEKKLALHDYVGAKKFVQKAQQLFPGLENISQMLAVIEVHVAAQAKLTADEMDWYAILQVDPTADDILIKKQYKKLALFLHPDKNKSVGAEAAFKLIGEASQVLSDRNKRMLHDMKRGFSVRATQNANAAQYTQNMQSGYSNGQYHGTHSRATKKANERHFQTPSQTAPPPPPPPLPPTFWTACPSCQMRYQYLRTYENQNLLCPHCRMPFLAKDLSSMHGSNAAYVWPPQTGFQQQHDFSQHASKTFGAGFGSFNGFTSGSRPDAFQNNPMYGGAFPTSMPASGTKTAADHVNTHYGGTAMREKAEVERKKRGEARKSKEMEKDLRRKDREQQKKSRAAEKAQESLDKLTMKKKEQAERAAGKEKKRRVKKHESDSSSEAEEEEDDGWEDMLSDDQGMQGVKAYPRRSSRAKRNVTYKVDVSDDDDFQELPPSKKGRVLGEGNDSGSLPHKEGGTSVSGVKVTGLNSERKEAQAETGLQNVAMAKKLADLAKNAIRMKLNLPVGKSAGTAASSLEPQEKKRAGPAEEERSVREDLVRGQESQVKREASNEPILSRDDVKSMNKGPGEAGLADKSQERRTEQIPGNGLDHAEKSAATYSVPDADFHDFDKGREEDDIAVGQIWALYDDQDGLPRYYIRVKEIHSHSPFNVTIAWLELRKPSEEQAELLDLGFSFTCGEFRNSKSQVMDSVNAFSHIVKWEKASKGTIKVYPRKGEVWGLYRDWEPGQQLVKVDDAPLKYTMVEVVTDFNEDTGVVVAPLVKVDGFKTLFRLSKESTLQIPSLELLRFSHQVPAHKLKGDEAPGVPEGCWELDPASVPTSLIFPDSDAEKAR